MVCIIDSQLDQNILVLAPAFLKLVQFCSQTCFEFGCARWADVKKKLDRSEYGGNHREFLSDMHLIFHNAMTYNLKVTLHSTFVLGSLLHFLLLFGHTSGLKQLALFRSPHSSRDDSRLQGSEIWNWAKELRDTLKREEAAVFAETIQSSRGAGVIGGAGRKAADAGAPGDDEEEGCDSVRVKGQPVGRPRGKSTPATPRVEDDGAGEDDDGVSAAPAPGRPRGRRASATVQPPAAAPVAPVKDGRKRRREED
jgi:hypothetical protein